MWCHEDRSRGGSRGVLNRCLQPHELLGPELHDRTGAPGEGAAVIVRAPVGPVDAGAVHDDSTPALSCPAARKVRETYDSSPMGSRPTGCVSLSQNRLLGMRAGIDALRSGIVPGRISLRPGSASGHARGFADPLAYAQPLRRLLAAATTGPLALRCWLLARILVYASAGLGAARLLVTDLLHTALREVHAIERILGCRQFGQVLCEAHQIAPAFGVAWVERHAGGQESQTSFFRRRFHPRSAAGALRL